MTIDRNAQLHRSSPALLSLLQLTSPALPVGAYSYSEGLETLVTEGTVCDRASLQHWLDRELHSGAIRLEAAVMVRACKATIAQDWQTLERWNCWLSATRETAELRQQSWQMGRALIRLLRDLNSDSNQHQPALPAIVLEQDCNFAIAFALAAVRWQIDLEAALTGYLHSWASNLVSAGVRLIPLGQTAGQQLLLDLQPSLSQASRSILTLEDDDLYSCSWGLSLASMAHEVQAVRLFRS